MEPRDELDDEEMDEMLRRVLQCARKRPDAKKGEVAWLARKLGTKVQVVNNWKIRGIPFKRRPAVAAAIGWSVEQLEGNALPPATWTFETIDPSRLAGLSRRQMLLVEFAALRELERIEAASGKPQPTAA